MKAGKKAYPAGRTGAIGARQLDGLPASCLDGARLLSTRPQWLATGRTSRTLLRWNLVPVLTLPHLHQILEQLGPHLVHLLDSAAVCSSWLSCSRSSLRFFLLVYHLPPFCKKMKHTRSWSIFTCFTECCGWECSIKECSKQEDMTARRGQPVHVI